MSRVAKLVVFSLLIVIIGGYIVLERDDIREEPLEDVSMTSGENKVGVNNQYEEGEVQIDYTAPDFTLEDLGGEEISLSDYRGKIVFLNFWATWCGYCDEEMPYFEKLVQNNEDIVVLAVNSMEDKKTVKDYIEKGKYSFPVVLDIDGEVGSEYVVGGLPNTYIIDREGNLLGQMPGMLKLDQMEEILEAIREM